MEDELPQRRRDDDLPGTDAKLILYQLSELKATMREGFQKMEGRFDAVEVRLTALERFRERAEERDRTEAAQATLINSRWLPLILTVLTLAVTIVLFIAGGK